MQIYTIKEYAFQVLTNIIRYMGGVTFVNYLCGSFVLKSCLLPSRI